MGLASARARMAAASVSGWMGMRPAGVAAEQPTGRSKMQGTAFPLSKNFSVQLGRNWRWRVDVVRAGGVDPPTLFFARRSVRQWRFFWEQAMFAYWKR
jgi:hypothetical protein